jgi:hypothetical protein
MAAALAAAATVAAAVSWPRAYNGNQRKMPSQ